MGTTWSPRKVHWTSTHTVNPTLGVPLSDIAAQQSKATELTKKDVLCLLDYCATHPNPVIRFYASDMILKIHSDAGYLNASNTRSRVGGHFYLGNTPDKPEINNGAILNPTGILRHVAAASEAELGALFSNMKEGLILRQTLTDIGRPQPATPVQADNSTAAGRAHQPLHGRLATASLGRYHTPAVPTAIRTIRSQSQSRNH